MQEIVLETVQEIIVMQETNLEIVQEILQETQQEVETHLNNDDILKHKLQVCVLNCIIY